VSACLDAWAVLAWLDGEEPALTRIDGLLDRGAVMSWVNAVEVYYGIERRHGREEADRALADIRGVLDLDLPGPALMIETARVKAAMPIALGDCFAVATATARGLPLLTGDPEILDRAGLPCAVEDLRAPA
jgi:uncharacterized protein with PIN domain